MKTYVGHAWPMALMVLFAGGSGLSAGQSVQRARPSLEGAMLDVRASAPRYVLGELVHLDISVTNVSGGVIPLPAGFDVWEGHVEVAIAFEDEPFRNYRGPGWGLRDALPHEAIALQAGTTVQTDATILYSHGIETRHLNKRVAGEVAARNLEEGYALARPGRYRIKAVLHGAGFVETIESHPTEIIVDEPHGPDRDAWAVLKTDPEYGYFIQAGGPMGHPDSKRSRQILAVLERIVGDYPRSRYAESLGLAISKHREVRGRLEELRLIQPSR